MYVQEPLISWRASSGPDSEVAHRASDVLTSAPKPTATGHSSLRIALRLFGEAPITAEPVPTPTMVFGSSLPHINKFQYKEAIRSILFDCRCCERDLHYVVFIQSRCVDGPMRR